MDGFWAISQVNTLALEFWWKRLKEVGVDKGAVTVPVTSSKRQPRRFRLEKEWLGLLGRTKKNGP